MQTTRTRRGSSFQERDSEGRFSNRSRGIGYGYENDYDDNRYNNRSPRYDEGDYEQGGYGRSSRYVGGEEEDYDDDYSRNRGRRAYDNSAEYDDEDYEYDDVNRYDDDEDEDYGTRGQYSREQRWGRRDFSSMNRGEYRNQPRGQHNSGWDERNYGNTSGRRRYDGGGGYNGDFNRGGFERAYGQGQRSYSQGEGSYGQGDYRQGRGFGSDMYEGGRNSRSSSGGNQGFASMPREEVRRIASIGGKASARTRRSSRSRGNQRSTRSRSRR